MLGAKPHRNGLLRWLVDHLCAEDVERVAHADSGFDWRDNLKALQRILSAGEVQAPIEFGASWVLEICSLTIRADPNEELSDGERRSVVFACTVLILAAAPGEPLEGIVNTLSDPVAALLVHVRALGPEARHHAMAMLADGVVRFADNDHEEPDDLFCGLGLFVLSDGAPGEAVRWLLDLEEDWLAKDVGSDTAVWLFRTTFFDGSKSIWRRLLLQAIQRGPSSSAHEAIADLVRSW